MLDPVSITRRLYWDDAYMKEFTAKVLSVDENKVVLDRTCFYPQGGGQVGDTGTISGNRVIDTRKDGETIVHFLESKPNISIGDSVSCMIDWERRYSIMKLHSASHIMEYCLFQTFKNLQLVGTYVTEKHDKSTYSSEKKIEASDIEKIMHCTNDFIDRKLNIKVYESDSNPDYRFWECDEIKIPCGGTHPRNTQEIGHIILKRKSGGSGKEVIITSLASSSD
jgi:alanyl-tRNA synthetase